MRASFADTLNAFSRSPVAFFRLLRTLPTMIRLYWRMFWDKRTGIGARLVLGATLGYVIWPLDLLPAPILGLIGMVDDLTVLVFGCQAFLRMVPKAVVDEHVRAVDPNKSTPAT